MADTGTLVKERNLKNKCKTYFLENQPIEESNEEMLQILYPQQPEDLLYGEQLPGDIYVSHIQALLPIDLPNDRFPFVLPPRFPPLSPVSPITGPVTPDEQQQQTDKPEEQRPTDDVDVIFVDTDNNSTLVNDKDLI
jgi:hypothetical protein